MIAFRYMHYTDHYLFNGMFLQHMFCFRCIAGIFYNSRAFLCLSCMSYFFLFLLVSRVGCLLWLWHSLGFSFKFCLLIFTEFLLDLTNEANKISRLLQLFYLILDLRALLAYPLRTEFIPLHLSTFKCQSQIKKGTNYCENYACVIVGIERAR